MGAALIKRTTTEKKQQKEQQASLKAKSIREDSD